MLASMTGYGSSEGQMDGICFAVEIRTVNNRYFKSRIKLPDVVGFMEDRIEKIIREQIARGMVNYSLELKNISAALLYQINEAGVKEYLEKLDDLKTQTGVDCHVDLGSLLALPGMMTPAVFDESQMQRIEEFVCKLTEEAVMNLKRMRQAEGAALAKDLLGHCGSISNELAAIKTCAVDVPKEYAKKLKTRADALLANVGLELNEEVLAREVVVYAERVDISEEISRMESHVEQFEENSRQESETNGQVGRRLEFISQEMLREANTMASKSSDIELTRHVLEIKCLVDRIKEQIQNVE